MTHSMTAFARVQTQLDDCVLCWEIRSVNHRYLDASFKLPEAFRYLETSCRSLMRDKINRGKIECQLKYQDLSTTNQSVLINEGLVNGLLQAANQLAENKQIANDINVRHLLTWPGVIQISQPDLELVSEKVLSLFDESLQQLVQVRMEEGKALKLMILNRLSLLKEQVNLSTINMANFLEETKDKFLNRLNSLQLNIAEGRVEQEIAILLTKLDVMEELDRLETHINEVEKIVKSDAVAGRRLDFLMQELNREANTLSSKSDSVLLTQSAVEMKVLIEQMREQIQNIE